MLSKNIKTGGITQPDFTRKYKATAWHNCHSDRKELGSKPVHLQSTHPQRRSVRNSSENR